MITIRRESPSIYHPMPKLFPILLSLALNAQPVAIALPDYNTDGPGLHIMVTDIYDADTLTVVLAPSPITRSWQREKIRLFDMANDIGINAPEIRGIQKPQGLISKLWAQEQLAASQEERLVTNGKRGKFGRLLGDVLYHCHPFRSPGEWCSLADGLVKGGLAEAREY